MADVVPLKDHREYERQVKRTAAGCLRDVRQLRPREVLVMGFDADGDFFVQASPPDPGNSLYLMALATDRLIHPRGVKAAGDE